MITAVLDIEADNLLVDATTAWIIGWKVEETGEIRKWLNTDIRWREELDKVNIVVGHNVIGYDLTLLKKLFNYDLPKHIRIRDTIILSQILDYDRFRTHSLAEWGEFLGFPKGEFDDFSHYSEEMDKYWQTDLELTSRVHKFLMKELNALVKYRPKIIDYMKAENAVAKWCGLAEMYGWPFDVTTAKPLLEKMEVELQIVRDKILPRMGTKTVAVDKKNGKVEPKKPKWRKDGGYDAHTCNWFGVDEWSGQDEDRLVEGPFSRIKFVDLDIDSVADVKIFLFRQGWIPTEWNTKTVEDEDKPGRYKKIKTSPKVTEDSLDCLEGDGKIYCEFLTTSSRVGILKGWLKNVDENGNLHGSCFTIGTPSMRARHQIIVNVPSMDSKWGPEMRDLFITKPGWKMIGTDSAGNQSRGLAHYLKNPEYIDQLLHGDIHTFNANVLDRIASELGVNWSKYLITTGVKADAKHTLEEALAKAKRGRAKRVLYAFLFGASGIKLWSYMFDKQDEKLGKKLKLGFTKAVPGFVNLLNTLEGTFTKTKQEGKGYIPGIGGNKIYCDSYHKLLVYLLQAAEKATCSCAAMLTMEGLENAGIPYQPLIMMHDEIDYLVPEEHAEVAAKISQQAFVDGPKLMGVVIMDGESKIGNSWKEVH